MSRPVKVIAIVISLLLVAGLVTAAAYASVGYSPKGTEPGLYVNGKRVEDPGAILKVGDNEVSLEDYRYYYLMNKYYYEMYYGDTYFEDDVDGAKALQLRKDTDAGIQNIYAWLAIAEEQGITLTDEEKAEVATTLQEQKEKLGDDYEDALQQMFVVSEEQYIRLMELQKLATKARTEQDTQVHEENDQKLIDDTVVSAKHILIAFDAMVQDEPEEEDASAAGSDDSSLPEGGSDASSAADTSDSDASSVAGSDASGVSSDSGSEEEEEAPPPEEVAALELAQYIEAQLRQSEGLEFEEFDKLFDEMRAEYDADAAGQPEEGYTFGEGQMVDEFYQAALALEVGEMSEPIRTQYGYHIILRVPLDEENVEENLNTLIGTQINAIKQEQLDKVLTALPLTYGEYYTKIKPENII